MSTPADPRDFGRTLAEELLYTGLSATTDELVAAAEHKIRLTGRDESWIFLAIAAADSAIRNA